MLDVLHETLRSLRAHALRFALTALGVAWGAFMLTYMSAAMTGVGAHFEREFDETGPKLVYLGGGQVLDDRVGERGVRAVELENEDVARFAALHSVEAATASIDLWSMVVRGGGRTRLLKVEGVDASARAIRNLAAQRGRFLSPLDIDRAARVAVIGPEAARRLYGHEDVVGRALQIESLTFRIVGVSIPKGEQLMNTGDPDDRKLWIPYTTAQRWFQKDDAVHELLFSPITRDRSADSIRHIRQLAGLHHDFDPGNDAAIWVFDVQASMAAIRAGLDAFRVFLSAAGAITLLVGAVGVMNIMLVVVSERRREIGLRKAVGATGRAIFVQFLAESAAVAATAALLGAALGIGLAKLTQIMAPEGTPMLSVPVFDPQMTATIVASLIAVGVVAGIAPALRAARTAPAEALRSF